jgi:hypothetical protein
MWRRECATQESDGCKLRICDITAIAECLALSKSGSGSQLLNAFGTINYLPEETT